MAQGTELTASQIVTLQNSQFASGQSTSKWPRFIGGFRCRHLAVAVQAAACAVAAPFKNCGSRPLDASDIEMFIHLQKLWSPQDAWLGLLRKLPLQNAPVT